jgi:ribosomal protein L30/L7E
VSVSERTRQSDQKSREEGIPGRKTCEGSLRSVYGRQLDLREFIQSLGIGELNLDLFVEENHQVVERLAAVL